jgi:hypothetical protein
MLIPFPFIDRPHHKKNKPPSTHPHLYTSTRPHRPLSITPLTPSRFFFLHILLHVHSITPLTSSYPSFIRVLLRIYASYSFLLPSSHPFFIRIFLRAYASHPFNMSLLWWKFWTSGFIWKLHIFLALSNYI